jgi:large repetitive protein
MITSQFRTHTDNQLWGFVVYRTLRQGIRRKDYSLTFQLRPTLGLSPALWFSCSFSRSQPGSPSIGGMAQVLPAHRLAQTRGGGTKGPFPQVRRALRPLLAAAAFLLVLPPAAHAAKAVHVSCGEIITTDTKLANDLTNCPRHGIVIGADNITLDLNGHTIDGDGVLFEPCPADEPCDVGIANSGIRDGRPFNGEGYEGVTIKNGSVREFAEVGIYVTSTSDIRVRAMTTSTSVYESDGVHFRDCTHCRIENSSASAYSVGFVVERSHDVEVDHNQVYENEFAGVLVALSEDVRITDNSATGTSDGDGIVVLDDSRRVLIEHNSSSGNAAGVGIQGSDHIRVTKNSLHDNRFVGTYVFGSDDNLIDQNSIVGNGDGEEGGIHLLPDEQGASSDGNVISKNELIGNDGDGILVDAGETHTLIEGNRANENTDDGIDVDSAATTLTRNTANSNHDLGIEAVPGVTDGGGNKATGNGNPLQCTNVFCR